MCDVPVNRGQGAALRWATGWRGLAARGDPTIDADGQYEPEEIGRVVEPILAGGPTSSQARAVSEPS